jgi:hypothetical protein
MMLKSKLTVIAIPCGGHCPAGVALRSAEEI